MVTIWPWRDMNELSFLQHVDAVPFTFRYDARFARMQFDGCVRFRLPGDPEAPGNDIEYLVPIRVDFASVRCVILNRDDSHGHAIDSGRRTRPLGSGGHGKVTVNVEKATRSIDWDNSVHQVIHLSSFARMLVARRPTASQSVEYISLLGCRVLTACSKYYPAERMQACCVLICEEAVMVADRPSDCWSCRS